MATRIRILEEKVANQIAAGEVVERPASVVRELVDNALDAGASRLDVELENGGKKLIRVTDNGSGMSYDDALLCIERHATSKIRELSDLGAIRSFGFRGEALPSIASVSRLRLLTREASSIAGTEIIIEGGKLTRAGEAGCAVGSSVEVRSLFSNVPARRKFLKKDPTEWAHIESHLRLVALLRPEVHLRVVHNGHPSFEYPKASTVTERVRAVMGRSWMDGVVPVQAREEGMSVQGFVGKPGIVRSSRHEQHFFVNGRPVWNAALGHALLEGYRTALPKGRYPVCVLFLEMPPGSVDVNVHPAKREVRFHRPVQVREFLAGVVAEALSLGGTAPAMLATPGDDREEAPVGSDEALSKESGIAQPSPARSVHVPWVPTGRPAELFPQQQSRPGRLPKPGAGDSGANESGGEASPPEPDSHGLHVVGSILEGYIVAENEQGVVLVDQRAAHERVMYEKILGGAGGGRAPSQRLLIPVSLELTPQESDFLLRQLDTLNRLGVEVSHLGGKGFMVDGLPPFVKADDVEDFFRGVLADLQRGAGESKRGRALDAEAVAMAVSHRAVRGGDSLRPQEVGRLLNDLHACKLPYTCPDGRPTMIMISRNELARKFGKEG